MSALLLLLLIGCKKAAPPAPQLEPALDRPPAPAGTVVDGVFHDAVHGITVRLPPGWSAEAGAADGALRVRLDGRGSNPTRVEVWRFAGAELAPRPKEGCSWTFQDLGPYFGIPGTEDLVLASCTPDAAGAPRVFAWVVARGGATWQFEVHAPWARMLDGHREGAAVLQTIRWDDQEN
jgi:hypothetical protein